MSAKYFVKENKNPMNEQPVCNREKHGMSQPQIIGKRNIRASSTVNPSFQIGIDTEGFTVGAQYLALVINTPKVTGRI